MQLQLRREGGGGMLAGRRASGVVGDVQQLRSQRLDERFRPTGFLTLSRHFLDMPVV